MPMVSRPRRKLTILLLVIALLGVASQVEASDGMRGDRCEVAADDYIVEDFYFFCRILDVRGTIDGDLIGIGAEITLHPGSVVTGDLWVGGGRLRVEGTVGDDIHFGGVTMSVSNRARFTHNRIDVLSIALDTQILEDAVLPGDLLVYGYQARVAGTVGGDVDFGGEALLIDGVVVGRVDAEVGDARRRADVPNLPLYDVSFENPGLHVSPGALIAGQVAYRSTTPAVIPPGTVRGRIAFEQSGRQRDITKAAEPDVAAGILRDYVVESVRDLLTLLILGAIGLRLAPNLIRQPALQIRRRTVPAIGWGLVTFMLSIPVVIVVLVIGLIVVLVLYFIGLNALTLMVGVGVVVISAGLVGTFGFLLFFMGRVVIAFMIGELVARLALRTLRTTPLRRWLATLAIGVTVYALLTNVPVPALGLIIELVTALAGVGAVAMYLRGLINASRALALRAQAAQPVIPEAVPAQSSPARAGQVALGLDNLPEGFTGFDEDW